MKQLNKYIVERLHINKYTGNHYYNYHPTSRTELRQLIYKLIKERGNDCDLNDIDTSEITNMVELFYNYEFNGDISNWNVSNVTDMSAIFCESKFTGENGNISNWNVSNVENMNYMFAYSSFTGENGDISNWDVSNVKYMTMMFYKSKFTGDISKWNVSNVKYMKYMFGESPLEKNPPKCYKN